MLPTPKKTGALSPHPRTEKLRLWRFIDLSELVQLKRAAFGTGPRPREFTDKELPVPASSVPLHLSIPRRDSCSQEVIETGRQRIEEAEFAPTRPPESLAAQLAQRSRPGPLGGLAAADES